MTRDDERRLVARYLVHVPHGTQDAASAERLVPTATYYAPEEHAREQALLFDRLPLVLGPAGADLPPDWRGDWPCVDGFGLRWGLRSPGPRPDLAAFLAGLGPDLESLDLPGHVVYSQFDRRVAANWKVVMEGSLENYHIAYVHPATASLYSATVLVDRFGPHQRMILGQAAMPDQRRVAPSRWRLRPHASIGYQLAPHTLISAHPDHLEIMQIHPEGPDACRMAWTILVPAGATAGAWDDHWDRLVAFCHRIVAEDVAVWDAMGATLRPGGLPAVVFGRNELRLMAFRDGLADAMAAGGPTPARGPRAGHHGP